MAFDLGLDAFEPAMTSLRCPPRGAGRGVGSTMRHCKGFRHARIGHRKPTERPCDRTAATALRALRVGTPCVRADLLPRGASSCCTSGRSRRRRGHQPCRSVAHPAHQTGPGRALPACGHGVEHGLLPALPASGGGRRRRRADGPSGGVAGPAVPRRRTLPRLFHRGCTGVAWIRLGLAGPAP